MCKILGKEAEDFLLLARVAAFVLEALDANAKLALAVFSCGDTFGNIGKRSTIKEHGAILTKCEPGAGYRGE